MNEVSLFRLYLLRALYLFIAVGLGVEIWPGVIHHDKPWELMEGVVACMLAALGALAIVGLRYPLQMLPLLLWEMLWKSIWLLVVALPLWSLGQMDKATWATTFACLMGVIVPLAIPWPYVCARFILKPGNRWR
ncbi:MAG: hypothetical protein JWP34_2079 [Massilia sp.]|jgi:hypothetical protein|nr:hypothetical protein [Massilia sp.]MDB5907965.1 hypothetical protein [Massilia sp.]